MNETALKSPEDHRAWWRQLNGYHWFVFGMAIFGWLFDTMDGQIFIASRPVVMKDVLPVGADPNQYGGYVTTIFILGWAIGGLLFGSMGDKWGRAKTMALTILVYAGFTGLSGIATTWWEFGLYRFLTGMGVGGEFAAGASLVAEAMPEKARAKCLGLVQAFSAMGNIMGAGLFWYVEKRYGWRVLYVVGAFPALLAVFLFFRLREPERWLKAKEASRAAKARGEDASKHLGSISDLFSDPRWRRNTIVGLMLGISGVLGLWGAGFFSPELLKASFPEMSKETQAKVALVAQAANEEEHKAAIAAFTDNDTAYVTLVTTCLEPAVPADQATKTPLTEDQRKQLKALLVTACEQALAASPAADQKERIQKTLDALREDPTLAKQAQQKTLPKMSAETIDQVLAVAKAEKESKFRDAVAAFKADEQSYVNLVSVWLQPKDRVVQRQELVKAKEDPEKTALRTKALMTPLNQVQREEIKALLGKALTPQEMSSNTGLWLILQQIGAFFGMMMYSYCATGLGRRPAFLFAFLIGWLSVGLVFYTFSDLNQVWYMAPLLGFGTLAPFGGYAMYFPEIFPTRLRNTGTSFCYNVGRFVAATGPFTLGSLSAFWDPKYGIGSFRLAAVVISCAYLLGIVVLIWAPETKDCPLPDDEVLGGPVAEPTVAH